MKAETILLRAAAAPAATFLLLGIVEVLSAQTPTSASVWAQTPASASVWAQTPTSASVWDGVYTDEQASRGDALYLKECVSCHGPTLEGGEMAPGLADGAFKANWNGLTMGDLYDRIHQSMPPDDPGRLSRQETADVLARLLSANQFPAGEKELPGRPEMLRLILFDPFR